LFLRELLHELLRVYSKFNGHFCYVRPTSESVHVHLRMHIAFIFHL